MIQTHGVRSNPLRVTITLALMVGSVTLPVVSSDDTATLNAKRIDPYWVTYFNVEEDLDKFGDYMSLEQVPRSTHLITDTLATLGGRLLAGVVPLLKPICRRLPIFRHGGFGTAS